jgi:3',5'-cyclic AMP phosphodiesterase CpdA
MRTIVHLSDLHFGRLDGRVVGSLLSAINELEPSLVAISGDLTQRARRRQFEEARAFLESIRSPRLVIPGNHDIPLYGIATRFLAPLADYRRFIADDVEPVFLDEEIVVLGLNSVRSLTFGRGRLNERQVSRAVEKLRGVAPSLIKIIVTHHPFDLPADYASHHLVGRAHMAMAQLAALGADLFLAGHLHVSHIGHTAERYEIAGHDALVVQAGTISTRLRGEANAFNILYVERPFITVVCRTWDAVRQTFLESSRRKFRHTVQGWIPLN